MRRKEEEWFDLQKSLALNFVLLDDGGSVAKKQKKRHISFQK
jgi:hypothetical protein